MFSGIKNFVSRHKRKFIVAGTIVGGTVLAVRYAQRKLIEFQEKQAREFMERQKRTMHFESTELTCNQAILGVSLPVCDEIMKRLDADPILEQLRKNPDNKLELWHELMVMAFTRIAVLVYACTMLVVSLRVQLNLIGGYLYQDVTSGVARITTLDQQNYLTLNQHFMQQGIESLIKLIEEKVRVVLAGYDLKQPLTMGDTEQIFWTIQSAVNGDRCDPNTTLAKYVFPAEIEGGGMLHKMYTETLDMLESEETAGVNTTNVCRGFSIVMDNIADFYFSPAKNGIVATVRDRSVNSITKADLNVSLNDSIQPTVNINDVQIPMAKLIPIINGLSTKPFSTDVRPTSLCTSLVTLFLVSDRVKMLGANVYEVFSQPA